MVAQWKNTKTFILKFMSKTIAILMPGDMGHGCGKAFKNNNFRVVKPPLVNGSSNCIIGNKV